MAKKPAVGTQGKDPIDNARIDHFINKVKYLSGGGDKEEPFAGFVRCIERYMGCISDYTERILLTSCDDKAFKDRVEAAHSVVKLIVQDIDNSGPWYEWEHCIIYDPMMPLSRKARLFCHEYWHLLEHLPSDLKRHFDPITRVIEYTEPEERDADIGSLVIIQMLPYRVGGKTPDSAASYYEMLTKDNHWPRHLTRVEVKFIVDYLYSL